MSGPTGDGSESLSDLWAFLNRSRTQGAGWFNLQSCPHWGNTTFLRDLKNQISGSPSFRDAFVLFVPSLLDLEDEVVPELGPIGNCLYRVDRNRTLTGLRLWLSRARNTPGREWWSGLRKEVALVMAFVGLLIGVTHLQALGLWGWAIAIAVLATYVSNHLRQFKGLAGPELRKGGFDQIKPYSNPTELVGRLDAVSASSSLLVLLVDDLHELPKRELGLLQNLIDQRRPVDAVRALRDRVAICIVTVDPTGAVPVLKEVISRRMPEPDSSILNEISALKKARLGHAESQASAILAKLDNGNQSVWGTLELAAICVADSENARTSQEWAFILSTEGSTLLKRHLDAVGLHLEESASMLLAELQRTPLFHRNGKSYYRDRLVAAAFRKLMEEQYRWIMFQASLFWFSYFEEQAPTDIGAVFFRHAIDLARWPEESMRLPGLARLLAPIITGARLCREKGDIELSVEALKLGMDLTAHRAETDETPAHLYHALAAEWALLYSWTGLPVGGRVEEGTPAPAVLRDPIWAIHLRQVEELVHAAPPRLLPDKGMPTEIQNLNRSAYLGGRVRLLGGAAAFADPALDIPDAQSSPKADVAEFSLFLARAKQALWSDDLDSFKTTMNRFRARLAQLKPSPEELGLMAIWLLGRSWHTQALHRWWLSQGEKVGPIDKTNPHYSEMCDTVWELCLEPIGDPDAALPAEVRGSFDNCLALSNLCSLSIVSVNATAQLTRLLEESPLSFQTEDPEWWLLWDHLFDEALARCKELKLLTLETEVRFYRYKFFSKLDIRSSAADAIQFYRLATSCHYPVKILAQWNQAVRSLITGHDIPEHISQSLAEIWSDWVNLVKEADWLFENEVSPDFASHQIEAFCFASQSYRVARHMALAEQCLHSASELITRRYGAILPALTSNSLPERDRLVQFYRECDLVQMKRPEANLPRVTIEQRWQMLLPDAFFLTTCLGDLLRTNPNLVTADWERQDVSDPLNPALTLVSRNEGSPPLPNTGYEFYLRLVIGWLTGDSWCPPVRVGVNARERWDSFESPEQCLFELARLGLKIPDIPELDALVVSLLAEAHYQTANVQHDDSRERESLELLMRYQPGNQGWRDSYTNVCRELEELLRREIEQSDAHKDPDLIHHALMIQSYLEPLESPELRAAYYAGVAPDQAVRKRGAIVVEATAKLSAGQIMDAWNLIRDQLDWPSDRPVTILQLRMLDIARRCAILEGSLAENVVPLTKRLHADLARYAHGFVKTIPGSKEQDLARRIEQLVRTLFDRAAKAAA